MAFIPQIHSQRSSQALPASTERAAEIPRRPKPSLPIAFVRSNLFGVNARNRNTAEDCELCTDTNIRLRYSGPRLNQGHSLLWHAVLTCWLEEATTNAGYDFQDHIEVTSAELLRKIGWEDSSTSSRRWLLARLCDLQSSYVDLHTQRHDYSGLLLDEVFRDRSAASSPLILRVNPGLVDLLKNETVTIDVSRKHELAGKQLALWLHDFISSQTNGVPIPFSVSRLHSLCGSGQQLAQFRPRVVAAAKRLQATTRPLLTSFGIDKKDRFNYSKTKTSVLILNESVGAAVVAAARAANAVERARAQRSRVAL